jgi:hypothetical protein
VISHRPFVIEPVAKRVPPSRADRSSHVPVAHAEATFHWQVYVFPETERESQIGVWPQPQLQFASAIQAEFRQNPFEHIPPVTPAH